MKEEALCSQHEQQWTALETELRDRSVSGDWPPMTSSAIQAALLQAAPRNPLARHPIYRRVYLIVFVCLTLFVLVPIWALLHLPKSRRPRPSWTLQRCLRVRWSRSLCAVVARCEIDYLGRNLSDRIDSASLTYSHPVFIPPAPAELLRGHPAEMLGLLHASRGAWIPPFIHRRHPHKEGVWGEWNADRNKDTSYGFTTVPAFWYTGRKCRPDEGRRPRQPGEPCVLSFHGGGHICGTAAETDLTSTIPKSLVEHTPLHHVLSVDYRLAPRAPWPLPLLDAISAYHYLLVHEGIPARDILICGDSAGGHLALALVRWIRDEGPALGIQLPRALLLMSPWCDVGFSNAWGEYGFGYNADSDTIDDSFGPFATSLLLRALPASLMHESAYLSPASLLLKGQASGPNSFRDFPPTYITYGGAERLALSIRVLWSRLQLSRDENSKGFPDALVEAPDAVHDFMIFPWQAKEASAVYEDLDAWLRELLSSDIEEDKEPSAQRQRGSFDAQKSDLRSGKSPVMIANGDVRGMLDLIGEMSSEGMSMVDMPELDLDLGLESGLTEEYAPSSGSDSENYAGDHPSEHDRGWYELETASTGSHEDDESRKDR